MNDSLTTAEQIFIEHWARRRLQALRSWLLVGAFGWGGLMSFFVLYEDYAKGRLSGVMILLCIGLFIIGGCLFGVGMWAFTEFRYRRMVAQEKKNIRNNT